jgi:hypothetical protein
MSNGTLPPSTGFTLPRLVAIETAIASGVTRVSYEGKTVDYQSLDVLLRIRSILQVALGLAPAGSQSVLVAHDRGYPAGGSFEDLELYQGY